MPRQEIEYPTPIRFPTSATVYPIYRSHLFTSPLLNTGKLKQNNGETNRQLVANVIRPHIIIKINGRGKARQGKGGDFPEPRRVEDC